MNYNIPYSTIDQSCLLIHNRISLDEGKKWDRHSFSLAPLFVDGVLMEPETENHIITYVNPYSSRNHTPPTIGLGHEQK